MSFQIDPKLVDYGSNITWITELLHSENADPCLCLFSKVYLAFSSCQMILPGEGLVYPIGNCLWSTKGVTQPQNSTRWLGSLVGVLNASVGRVSHWKLPGTYKFLKLLMSFQVNSGNICISENLVIIGLDNGLAPAGAKLLSKPMMSYH